MKNKIAIKRVGSPLEITTTSVQYRCDMKEFINSDRIPEMVSLGNNLFLLADEDGRMKKLKHNFYLFLPQRSFPVQTIIGAVAFVRIKPILSVGEIYDYELDSITDADVEFINTILEPETQCRLKEVFLDLYKDEENPEGYWGYCIKEFTFGN